MHQSLGRSSLHRLCRSIPLFLAVLVVLVRVSDARAASALGQLCDAANPNGPCPTFNIPTPTPMPVPSVRSVVPRTPVPRMGGGGAFGGIMGSIMGQVLENMIADPAIGETGVAADPQAAAQAAAEAAKVQALQQAAQEQQRIQAERESRLLSQLRDRPATQLLDSTQDLETLRADAGRPFDGNAPADADQAWMDFHDPWFSPPATPVAAGSQPVALAGQPPLQGTGQMPPAQCMGRLCAFPPGNTRVPIVKSPGPAAPPPVRRPPGVNVEMREVGSDQIAWSARRDIAEALDAAHQPEIPATFLMGGFVQWAANVGSSGIQGEVAHEGRGIYQRVMEEVIAQTFEVLRDAAAGRTEEALQKSSEIGDRVRESILPEFKLARLVLSGDGAAAGELAGDAVADHASDVAYDKGREILDKLPGPEWVKEGAGYSADIVKHWLQQVRAPQTP